MMIHILCEMIIPFMDDWGGMKKRPVLQPKRLHRGFRLDVQPLSGLALLDPTDLQLVGGVATPELIQDDGL